MEQSGSFWCTGRSIAELADDDRPPEAVDTFELDPAELDVLRVCVRVAMPTTWPKCCALQ